MFFDVCEAISVRSQIGSDFSAILWLLCGGVCVCANTSLCAFACKLCCIRFSLGLDAAAM